LHDYLKHALTLKPAPPPVAAPSHNISHLLFFGKTQEDIQDDDDDDDSDGVSEKEWEARKTTALAIAANSNLTHWERLVQICEDELFPLNDGLCQGDEHNTSNNVLPRAWFDEATALMKATYRPGMAPGCSAPDASSLSVRLDTLFAPSNIIDDVRYSKNAYVVYSDVLRDFADRAWARKRGGFNDLSSFGLAPFCSDPAEIAAAHAKQSDSREAAFSPDNEIMAMNASIGGGAVVVNLLKPLSEVAEHVLNYMVQNEERGFKLYW
jgi:hypothetical protein